MKSITKNNLLRDNCLIVPKPYTFISSPLRSATTAELGELLTNVSGLLSQLSGFISQFHDTINNNQVNVITDTWGNLSIDVPGKMSDIEAEEIRKRVLILDNIISDRRTQIETLLQKGSEMEIKIIKQDPNFQSQILEKVNRLKEINKSYSH